MVVYRFLPGFREFAVFEKSKRFFYIFFGWVLHRGGQGPGKGPNMYVCMYTMILPLHFSVPIYSPWQKKKKKKKKLKK